MDHSEDPNNAAPTTAWSLSQAYGQRKATKDVTLYWSPDALWAGLAGHAPIRDYFGAWQRAFIAHDLHDADGGRSALRTSLEENVLVEGRAESPPGTHHMVTSEARCCLCSCFRRSAFSATLRSSRAITGMLGDAAPRGWELTAEVDHVRLTETGAVARTIWSMIGKPGGAPQAGLIVVAGGTCSGKSSLARCLALKVIHDQVDVLRSSYAHHDHWLTNSRPPEPSVDRYPHLVTCEDPIEGWEVGLHGNEALERLPLTQDADGDAPFRNALQCGFCFTPRELRKDVGSIREAVDNALRQTPSCLYIGEIRRDHEWDDVLRFSGTGHLAVATTHAHSLVELMHRLLVVSNARSPAKRRELSTRLLAAVHVRLENCTRHTKVSLPAIWANSAAASNSLVGEGLASVVPNGHWVFNREQMLLRHWTTIPQTHRGRLKPDALAARNIARALDLEDLRSP